MVERNLRHIDQERDQCLRNDTGYIAVDSTPAIAPAVAPTAHEPVIQYITRMTTAVPITTAPMNAANCKGVGWKEDTKPMILDWHA